MLVFVLNKEFVQVLLNFIENIRNKSREQQQPSNSGEFIALNSTDEHGELIEDENKDSHVFDENDFIIGDGRK